MAINKVITKPPKIHAGLKNCLTYVLRSDKTEQTLTSITGPYKHKELKLKETLCLNQELSKANQNVQEELRKVLTDLSDITRLNQQLSIENDNLRNKGGWMLKEKQEKLEREIENVRVRNVKLNYLVNMSNVAAVETMRVERDDALLQAEEERQMALAMKEYCKNEVAKANKKANKRILEIKNKKEFWQIISITSLCVGVLIGQMI